jgi:hypothetical protein
MANETRQINYRVGEATVSKTQREYLVKAQHAFNARDLGGLFNAIQTVIRDKDITSGKEEVSPEWIKIFETSKADLKLVLPGHAFVEIEKIIKSLPIIDPPAFKLDFSKLRVSFLLGAGASKPTPSNIPTVKELLPELFTRARNHGSSTCNVFK